MFCAGKFQSIEPKGCHALTIPTCVVDNELPSCYCVVLASRFPCPLNLIRQSRFWHAPFTPLHYHPQKTDSPRGHAVDLRNARLSDLHLLKGGLQNPVGPTVHRLLFSCLLAQCISYPILAAVLSYVRSLERERQRRFHRKP